MQHQLLPSKQTAPSLPAGISPAGSVRIWVDLMKSAEKLLMAGFASRVGSERARDAYRDWYAETAQRHGRHIAQLAGKLRTAGEN